MSTAQAVTQHLPFLRRYARALTGSQQSGDAYVTTALEALIADPSVVSQANSPRVALYHLFTKIWNSVDVNAKSEPATDPQMPVEQRLGHITPLPRQAFLLVALEGFSEEDAAAILDIDVRSVRGWSSNRPRACGRDRHRRADHRGRDVHRHGPRGAGRESRPPRARRRPHAFRGGGARQDKRPGLILADIQLADGSSGLDAVNELLQDIRGAGDLHHRLSGALPHR